MLKNNVKGYVVQPPFQVSTVATSQWFNNMWIWRREKIYLIMFQFYLQLQIRSERSLAYVLCISTCQMALIIIMETEARLFHEV